MSTNSKFSRLVDLGVRVKCIRSGEYFNLSETNNYKGQRIAKRYDYLVHDDLIDKTKYLRGKNWERGGSK